MNIMRQLSKVFKAWGTDASPENFFNNYWRYMADAIDGSWGSTITDDVIVYHLGRVCYWQTSTFIASGIEKELTIPLTSNSLYSATIYDQTSKTVSCVSVSANNVVIPLVDGHKFQVVSSLFVPSGL
jgi:hypothetical protein